MKEKINVGFLFDLDGVIIDSEKEYSLIWSLINKEFPSGIESFEEKIKGTTLEHILTQYYPEKEIQEKVVKRLYDMEENMEYEYKEGAKELLKGLKDKGISKALVTSSNNKKMNNLDRKKPELRNFFEIIITGDMIVCSKPHPEGYLRAARMLGCNPKNCVVFEDSLQGVKAGYNSGAYVVGIEGTLKGETLKPFSHTVVNTLAGFDIEEMMSILNSR